MRSLSTYKLLKRLVQQHVRQHFKRLFLAMLCMTFAAGSTAALAYMMESVLDDVFIDKDREMLILVPCVIIIVTLIKGAATYGQSVMMAFVGQRIIADLQSRLFNHVIRFDLAFFQDTASGKLVSRMTNDINLMRNAVSNALTGLIKDSLTLIFLVAVMFEKDWKLALLAFIVFPLASYPIIRIGKRMRKLSTSALDELGRFTARLSEAFQGARHVKAYNMEAFEAKRTDKIIENVFSLIFKALRTRAAASPIMETLGGLFIALVVLYGGWQVIDESLTPGEFFAFITAMLLAYQPLKALANLNTNLQEGLAAAQRVFDILDIHPKIKSSTTAQKITIKGGEIVFKNVSFSYSDQEITLEDISLNIPAGKTIALVGPSGSGKSTILNMIPRFYDCIEGKISIDGINVKEVELSSLRNAIGLVSQETVLFDDTVKANILYGCHTATDLDILTAAKNAGAHKFISDLPNGYDTLFGPFTTGGSITSAGKFHIFNQ